MPKPYTEPIFLIARKHVGLEVAGRHVAGKLTVRQECTMCVVKFLYYHREVSKPKPSNLACPISRFCRSHGDH